VNAYKFNTFILAAVAFLLTAPSAFALVAEVTAEVEVRETSASASRLGILKGVVRDDVGRPIAAATVEIFRDGASKALRQVVSSADGSFLAKLMPGKYRIAAAAQGFSPATLLGIEIARASESTHGIRLKRAGTGNTIPEQRVDKNSSKWRIRAAQMSRSIYQNAEGDTIDLDAVSTESNERETSALSIGKPQTAVETYFANSNGVGFMGVNAATVVPIGNSAEVMLAGQTTTGGIAQRIEARLAFKPFDDHEIRIGTSYRQIGSRQLAEANLDIAQWTLSASDQWNVREGLILLYGVDYTNLLGSDSALTPRLGFQFDLGSKTRLRAGYYAVTEEKNWATAFDTERSSIAFSEPVFIEDVVTVQGRPKLNLSRRTEFGIERVLDGRSSIEALAFFDTTTGRGVGIDQMIFDGIAGPGFEELVAEQNGRTQGVRVVYTRRINTMLTASAGYAYGTGQRLAATADASKPLESDEFQTFYGQLNAQITDGTSIRTIYRLSPNASIFAIDPFRGRLTIYDPGLSVLITRTLPTFGLPLRAEAVIDARNLIDTQSLTSNDEMLLRVNAQRRTFRGGIHVRF
jgi:hypothetical protein